MYKKEVVYEDFDGETQTETLYFNLSKAELTRMTMEEMDFGESDSDTPVNGLADRMRNVVERREGREIVKMFDWLLKASYGVRSEDGKRFRKSDELFEDWKASPSYDEFYMELVTNTEAMIAFVNGILPGDIRDKVQEDPEFKRHTEELRNRSIER